MGVSSLIFIGKSAGEGNRTLVCSLGSCRSTIELHPHADFRFSIDDFRFASRQQSLPRNHVIRLGSSSEIFVNAIAVSAKRLIFTIRPCNHALLDRINPCTLTVWIGGYAVVVIAVDPHIIGSAPWVPVLANRAWSTRAGDTDTAFRLSRVLYIWWRDKDDLSCVKQSGGCAGRVCCAARAKFVKEEVVCVWPY